MKKFIISALSLCIMMCASQPLLAQNGKEKRENAKIQKDALKKNKKAEFKTKGKAHMDSMKFHKKDMKRNKDSLKSEMINKGHAFGKDNELESNGFGQKRAERAKIYRDKCKKELQETLNKSDQKIKIFKEKIKNARELLEKEKKEGKATKEIYQEKLEKIKKAEAGIKALQEKVEKAKMDE